ncbi:hypothetical protein DYB31_007254 [Aphanomyces astaci]|uniref:Uncharacterized protein n=1 Tax=Aphanomyces astaci TaxID=112090 RepID=A0A397FPS2_APHAT|nr:hypothetical protein DYB31_007254 [Aphanomyces astaci]
MSRPSASQSQNVNNFLGERSSTRLAKPPGGGSTMGSLIYGGDVSGAASFGDDRKGRRGMGSRPEQSSGSQVFHQEAGAIVKAGNNNNTSKDAEKYQLQQLQYQQQQQDRRMTVSNQGSSDIFLRNAPNAIAGDRRTKRMYGGGQSDFKLSTTNTLSVVSVPRHWQSFAFVRNACRVEFEDGSVAHDSHLEGLQNVREVGFRQCDFIQSPSALARCHTLRFVSCDALADVSSLTHVKHLNIAGSRAATNAHKLTALETLVTGSTFSSSPLPAVSRGLTASAVNVPWAAMPLLLSELHLKQCHTLPSAVAFQVTSVTLSSCDQLESIACFRLASHLEIVRTRLLHIDAFVGFSLLQSIRLQASTCLQHVTALQHVHDVSLSLCVNLQDISPLAHANSVEISCCPQLQSVTALSWVPHVSLSRCADLVDVSGLTHNHVVRVSECYRVTQVSTLRERCHTVDIARCFRITDADLLHQGSMHTVTLSGCNLGPDHPSTWTDHATMCSLDLSNNLDIVHVASLAHLHTIHLNRTSVRVVAPLAHVHTLSLSGCELLEDVSALGGVHTLDLSYCTSVRDVSALGLVHTLNLAGTLVDVVADLKTVYDLNLSGCPCISDDQVNQLVFNHTLSLMGCGQLTRVDGLGNVHTLNLANCVGLTDVSMLGHIHTLDLTGCVNVGHIVTA